MIVQQVHEDGSRTVIYEPGDRVRLLRVGQSSSWIAKAGELATVIRRDRPRVKGQPTSIDFLYVQTDSMKAGGWGSIHVAPWDLEALEAAANSVKDSEANGQEELSNL